MDRVMHPPGDFPEFDQGREAIGKLVAHGNRDDLVAAAMEDQETSRAMIGQICQSGGVVEAVPDEKPEWQARHSATHVHGAGERGEQHAALDVMVRSGNQTGGSPKTVAENAESG